MQVFLALSPSRIKPLVSLSCHPLFCVISTHSFPLTLVLTSRSCTLVPFARSTPFYLSPSPRIPIGLHHHDDHPRQSTFVVCVYRTIARARNRKGRTYHTSWLVGREGDHTGSEVATRVGSSPCLSLLRQLSKHARKPNKRSKGGQTQRGRESRARQSSRYQWFPFAGLNKWNKNEQQQKQIRRVNNNQGNPASSGISPSSGVHRPQATQISRKTNTKKWKVLCRNVASLLNKKINK